MDFFDSIYLDNSVRNYCIVAGSILLAIVLKRYLSRYLAALLFRGMRRIWNNIGKQNFAELVLEPLEWFLLILITVFAIDKLNFPDAWQYKIYGHSIQEILDKAGKGIIIISITWLLMRMIDFIAIILEQKSAITPDKSDDQLIVFFRDFLKVLMVILGLLFLLKACFGQPVGALLTSLSIVGAVLALAAKESLENLIASFIIFFDKPFAAGDVLKVNAVTGTVERIGLRSTRIRTFDKTLVTVPNKQMVDSVVDNWSLRTHRRAEIKLELSPQTTSVESTRLIEGLKKMLEAKKGRVSEASVQLTDLNKNGLVVTVEYFTQNQSIGEFNALKEELLFSIKNVLEENKLMLASAANSVTIITEPRQD
jgi:MscS family membrane protein